MNKLITVAIAACLCVAVHAQALDDIERIALAIAQVESRYNPKAESGQGDYGILQQRAIYVKEVNRVCGTDYKPEDTLDPKKAFEMFRLMNGVKNPKGDFIKAVKIHNPGCSQGYIDKVMKAYNEVVRYERARASLVASKTKSDN